MSKSWKKTISVIGCAVCAVFSGCSGDSTKRKPFVSDLTAEEHIADITKRTEEKYAEALEKGAIIDFWVYILWSFNEQPESFVVEFDGKSINDHVFYLPSGDIVPDEAIVLDEKTVYWQVLGYIGRGRDQYRLFQRNGYPSMGKSPVRKLGFENEKIYYNYHTWAVEKDGEMICVEQYGTGLPERWPPPGAVVSKSQQKYLATHDYRMPDEYY
jgi:hypothetical protein